MLFNLDFVKNTILLCFFTFFLILDLSFLIPAVITQIFNPTAEFVIPIGIPIKEAKAEMKTHPLISEIKFWKYNFRNIIQNSTNIFMVFIH